MGQALTYLRSKHTEVLSEDGLVQLINTSKYCVALTGSGVSAESGIPTFRDPSDGLWNRHGMADCATIWGFKRNPDRLWKLLIDVLKSLDPKPNPSHYALAALEDMGLLKAIITQNVDSLHQDAGSVNVIEFHGNLMESVCLKCHRLSPINRTEIVTSTSTDLPPKCSVCGGVLKPNAVLFGESIPSDAVTKANHEIGKCDLLLVIGTSADVTPAANIPYQAMKKGAKVIEVNIRKTSLTDRISDGIVYMKSSQMKEAVEGVKRLRPK